MQKLSRPKINLILLLLLVGTCQAFAQFSNLPLKAGQIPEYDVCGVRAYAPGIGVEYERRIPFPIPLLEATYLGDTAEIRKLIAAGADIYLKDLDQRSALLLAIKVRNLSMVQFFFAKDKKEKFSASLDDALEYAVMYAPTNIVDYILDKGADPEGKDKKLGQPLGIAAQVGNIDTVKLLLERGAQPNSFVQGGFPAITGACIKGNLEVVNLLIEGKADVNPKKQDWSPLTEAARGNHVEVMKLLIKAGANLNEQAYDGLTPLMMAASSGMHRPHAVKVLIDSGADVNLRDDDDEKVSALAIARANDWDDIVIMLLEAGAVD